MKQLITILAVLFSATVNAQNVGIGETNPTGGKLHVKSADSAGVLIHNSTSSGVNVKTGLFFKTGANYSGSISTIGSGATFRMGLFTYGGSTPSSLIERISIGDGGNVGIGKSFPIEKLDVNGDLRADTILPKAIKMTPNAAVGKILTSDAIGNATWQEAKASNGSVGFGTWGDCSTNNISEFNPVADTTFQDLFPTKFGQEVSISGNYAVVGAEDDDKIGVAGGKGSASIYQFSNGIWTLMQKITDASGLYGDNFGSSVAISGNYILIGSKGRKVGANDYQGSVSVYTLSGGTWVNTQRLTDPSGIATSFFGSSVSISGNYVIIGAPSTCCGVNIKGTACIYQLLLGSFIFMQKITDATGAINDFFGSSVSISGNNVIVGSPGLNSNTGAASIYKLSSGTWALTNKFTGDNFGDEFGASVSISGNNVFVGIPGDDFGSISNRGLVNNYQFINNNWVQAQYIYSNDVVTVGASFGSKVFISGNYAIISIPGGGDELQGVTIYQRLGFVWQKVQYIKNPIPSTSNVSNDFGYSAAIDENTKRFMIGSPYFFGSPIGSGIVIFGKLNF
jgi:FG-GAP repeat